MGATAWCDGAVVRFRLPDPQRRLAAVRLSSTVLRAPFEYAGGTWVLDAPRPAVHRLEYRLDLTHADGRTESVCDPGNPLRVPGGYGDNSELRCPGYAEPWWLAAPAADGTWRELRLPLSPLHDEVTARVWSPSTATDGVLVAHDGPDYDGYGVLGRYTAALIRAGRVPPYHLVLLPPGDRLEWYSANSAYARALAGLLTALRAELGPAKPVVGVGASLGALAMLHAQRRHPAAFGGLFLQSGSFFQPRFDRQESGFRRYLRIVRFVSRVLRDTGGTPVPAALTCGAVEENRANNSDLARALGRQGYPVTYAEVPDAHHWVGWRDALDPHLTSLLSQVWA